MSSSVCLYPRLSICTLAVLYRWRQSGAVASGPCCYRRRSLTFCPRARCCVAWYNALPAHLPCKIVRVQMRALKIIYLWKLYTLLKSLDLRTGAVSNLWLNIIYLLFYISTWSYENRVSKHFVTFLHFRCLIACLLCCLLMSVWLVLWLGICVEVDVDRITI